MANDKKKIEDNKRETYADGVKLCLQVLTRTIDSEEVYGQNTHLLRKAVREIIDSM